MRIQIPFADATCSCGRNFRYRGQTAFAPQTYYAIDLPLHFIHADATGPQSHRRSKKNSSMY
jgi:hypothetical protein